MDPNIAVVELTAAALGSDLLPDFVLIGGCAVGLLVGEQLDMDIRPTIDVDFVVQVAGRSDYYAICDRLRNRGFREASDDKVICRWRNGNLLIDVMPTDEKVLGFSNAWYPEAIRTATQHQLPTGMVINLVRAPEFIATKLDSFYRRGNGDLMHHDMEDIVSVLEGRASSSIEIAESSEDLRSFLGETFEDLLINKEFHDKLPWLLGSTRSNERYELVVSRMRQVAGI